MPSRLLADNWKDDHPAWMSRLEVPAAWRRYVHATWRREGVSARLRSLLWALRWFRLSRAYPAMLASGDTATLLCSAMQHWLRRRPTPLFFIDGFRRLPASKTRRRLALNFYRSAIRGACRVIVYSRRQIATFAHTYGLPEEKFAHVPYHSTLYGADIAAVTGDYVFAGGDFTRDYAGLIEAVRPLPYPVVIACLYRHYFAGIHIPANVQIVTVDHRGFLELMARSRLVALPFQAGLLHSGGQQTYLNAMALGKPVIVADDCGADEYVQDNVSGLAITPGEPTLLRDAIIRLMQDDALATRLGENARFAAREFTPEKFFERVFAIVDRDLRALDSPSSAVSG